MLQGDVMNSKAFIIPFLLLSNLSFCSFKSDLEEAIEKLKIQMKHADQKGEDELSWKLFDLINLLNDNELNLQEQEQKLLLQYLKESKYNQALELVNPEKSAKKE